MYNKNVGFIHTTPATIAMVEKYMKIFLPRVECIHIYNGNVKRANFSSPVGVTPKINLLRYASYAQELQGAGCTVIVSCCSLMPRATEYASMVVDVPFIQLDSVILDKAVEKYSRIGVVNTTDYVVPYVKEGLESRAAARAKKIDLVISNTAALSLFNAGDFDTHDRIVLDDMRKLDDAGVDCILMAQIPFALMEEKIKASRFRAEVLFAGEPAFKHIQYLLGE
jgi:aspartate/glutamate racemase